MITPADGEAADTDRVRESIDMAVFSAVPDFVRVTVRLDDLGTGGATARAAARALLARAWPGDDATTGDPHITPWRAAYEAVGLSSEVRPPHEVLARWASVPGGVPSQGVLNDVANAFSLQHRIPVSVYDTVSIVGDLWLAPARGLETFVPVGDGPAEVLSPGELILADGAGNVVARNWHGAQGRLFVADTTVCTALVHLDLLPPGADQASSVAEAFVRLATGFLGGRAHVCCLSWDTPRTVWLSPS